MVTVSAVTLPFLSVWVDQVTVLSAIPERPYSLVYFCMSAASWGLVLFTPDPKRLAQFSRFFASMSMPVAIH